MYKGNNMIIILSSGRFGYYPVIDNNTFNTIKNAKSRDSIGTMLSRSIDIILDWVCNTDRTEAKKLLFDIISENSDINAKDKYKSFLKLQKMVLDAYKDSFKVESSHYELKYWVELPVENDMNYRPAFFKISTTQAEEVKKEIEEEKNNSHTESMCAKLAQAIEESGIAPHVRVSFSLFGTNYYLLNC